MCIFSYSHFHCIHTTALYIYNYNTMILPLINKQITRVIRFRHFSLSLSLSLSIQMKIVLLRVCDCVLCVMAITSSYYGACHRILCTYIHIYISNSIATISCIILDTMYSFNVIKRLRCRAILHLQIIAILNASTMSQTAQTYTHTHTSEHTWILYMYVCMEKRQFSGSGSENGSQTVNRHQISFGSRHQDVVKHFVYGCMWYIFWLM